jgi:hypothetical protein
MDETDQLIDKLTEAIAEALGIDDDEIGIEFRSLVHIDDGEKTILDISGYCRDITPILFSDARQWFEDNGYPVPEWLDGIT